jgi:hypothetical protein
MLFSSISASAGNSSRLVSLAKFHILEKLFFLNRLTRNFQTNPNTTGGRNGDEFRPD